MMTNQVQSIYDIAQNAYQSSNLVHIGLIQSRLYNQAVYAEQSLMLDFSAHYVPLDISITDFQTAVLARVDNDLAVTHALNNVIAYSEFYTANEMTYALKTNKMHEALTGARELILDPLTFEAMIKGDFPQGFDQGPSFPVLIGEVDRPFGNSQNTFLSTALIEIATTALGEEANLQDLGYVLQHEWLDHSALVHVTPINQEIFDIEPDVASIVKEQYTFGVDYADQSMGLAYVHSGYAFGGYRSEPKYEQGKLFAPEDCSSWLVKLSSCEQDFSTVDMLNAYRALSDDTDLVESTWLNSKVATALFDAFSPVEVIDPLTDIQAGQIIVFRKYTSEDHSGLGYAGHTGLVLGATDDGQVVTLNYARDMPGVEGFGINLYDYQSSDLKEVFFLEPKNTVLALEDILQVTDDDLAFWEHTSLFGDQTESNPQSFIHTQFELELPYFLPIEM